MARNSGSEPIRASGNWIRFIQKMIANVLSVRVSFLVVISVMPNASAAARTSSAAGRNVSMPGRRITSTPARPSTTAPIRLAVIRSPKTGTASSNVHAGVVNSSANTVANGSSRRLIAQRYCPPR